MSARNIAGHASTSELDRTGDTVDVTGAKFKTPMPLLLDHNHKQVIGTVTSMQVIGTKLLAHATLLPPGADALADNAWAKLQAKALSSFSIGFQPLDGHKTETGMHFSSIDIHELSIVGVPANAGAKILAVAEAKAAKPVGKAGIPADAKVTHNFTRDPSKPERKLKLTPALWTKYK
ncbi:HK97 family phage prohead protease [Paraburkholderia sp. RL18-103-BIB-C]|uniref:HK97 family phage prohead protease n=1 Tax=Paraburkholderia sp. RL18-103-BIB-C TaxID=3031637 RepID=UPI0038BB5608